MSSVADICNSATSFSLPYTSTTNSPNQYSITAGIPAMSGFSAVSNASLGSSPISVTIPANVAANTYQFNLIVTNSSTTCSSNSQSFTVKINATPTTPTVTTPINYCQNASTSALSATATGTLEWYGTNATGGVASTTAPTPSSASVGTTTYYVSQIDANNCESSRASIGVVINANPVVPSTTTSISYCKNATASALTATATSGNSLIWYDANDNVLASVPTPNTATVGTQTYKVSQKTPAPANCEGPKATITVTINDNPVAPTVTTPVGYCQNATASQLSATAAGTLQWYGTAATGGVASTTAPTPSTSAGGTTTYYVSQKDVNNCESPRANIDVVVTPTLGVSVSGNSIFCITGEINKVSTLTATPSGGNGTFVYQWQNTSGVISGATNSTYGIDITIQPSTAVDYSVVVTSGYCTKTSSTKNVSQNGWIDVPSVTGNTANCGGTATLIASSSISTGSFRWYKEQSDASEVSTGTISGTRREQYLTPTLTSNTYYYLAREQSILGVTCQTNRTKVDIAVTPPSAPSVTSPVTYCQNAVASVLSATGSNLLWYTASTGGTGSSTAPTPVTTSAGTTSYYVSQTLTGCESSRSQIDVVVNATPAIPTVSSPVTYCQNAAASALSATGSNLLWYTASTGGTGSSTAPTPVTTSAGTTSYYVSQTLTGCESSRSQIDVVVNATPAVPTVSSPVTYCQNAVASALSATGSNLLWYTASTGGTGSSTAPTPVTTSAGTTSYYVSQTLTGCESSRSQIDVVVNATPAVPTVSSPVTYCQNAAASALSATGSNLLWYTASTGGTGSSTAPTPVTTSAGTTSYYVSQTLTGCESSRSQIDVVVNATPAIPTVSSPVTYCQNAVASALSATGSNLLWYTASTGGTGSSTAPTPVTTSAGTTSYYVSQTLTGCESSRSQIDVVVNATPAIPTVSSPVTYCQNAAASALSATGSNLLWYTASTGGTGSSTAPTPVTTSAGTTSYYVSQMALNGCESSRIAIQVIVNPYPVFSTQPLSQTNCKGLSSTFSGTVSASATLQWQYRKTSADIFANVGSSSTGTTLTFSATSVGSATYPSGSEFVLTATSNGCTTTSNVAALNVNSITGIIPAQTICEGSSTIFDLSSLTIVGTLTSSPYQWEISSTSSTTGFSTITGANSNSYIINPTTSNDENKWYRPKLSFTNTASGTCTLSPTGGKLAVTVIIPPVISIDNATICNGKTAKLTATGCTGTIIWSDNQSGTSVDISPTANTSYTATCTQSGCTSKVSNQIDITVNPIPTAPAITGVGTICEGQSTTLTATVCTTNVKWSDGQSGTSITVNPTVTTNYTATCIVNGCESLASTVYPLTVNPKPSLPTNTTVSPICEGNTLTFSANGTSLNWYSAATGGTASSTAPTYTAVGTYTAYVSQVDANSCESNRLKIDASIIAKPTAPVSIGTTICIGKSTTLAISNTCSGTLKWYDASSNTLATMPVSPTVNTNYYSTCTVGTCVSDASNTVTIVVNAKPSLPSNTTVASVCEGSGTLTFSASGTNLLWYDAATGGTGSSTAPSYTAAGTYTNWVTQTSADQCESDRLQISATIYPLPSITTQPTDQTDCKGNGVTFSVSASVTSGTLAYQWQRKKVGETVFTDISGATSSSLNISNVGDANNPHLSEYQCVITTNGCSVTSNIVVLNVNSLTGTLAAQTACEGQNVTFDLSGFTLVGTVSSYQWQKRASTSGSWTDISGATSNSLSLSNITSADAAYYRCKVVFSNGGSSTCITYTSTGNGAKLTVNAKPAIPTNTTSTSACSGSTLTFSATGSNLLWYTAATGGVGSTTAPSYTAAGTYTNYVSQTVNGCESDRLGITAEIKSTVSPVPTNTTPAVVCVGSTLTFSATGNNLLWYTSATGGTGSTTAPVYTAAGTYIAYVSQTVDGCESARLQINSVIPNPSISTQPTNQSDCDGNSVSFKVTASTTTGGTLSYQWQMKKPSDASFSNIATGTTNTLTVSNIGDANNPTGTQYQCIITENGCLITSNTATLSVNSATGTLVAQTLCEGASTTFDVSSFTVTGTPTYQWQKRVGTSGAWNDISGGTTAILNLNAVTSSDNAYYRCKFTFTNLDNTTCTRYTSTGNGAKLTVNAKPEIPTNTTSSACSGNTLTFSATGSNLLWYTAATGGVGSTTAPSYTAAGTYTNYVSQTVNGCESDRLGITAEIKSTVSPLPTNTTPAVICSGSTLTFSATGNNLLWYTSATGGTGSTTAPVYTAAGTYIHWVSATNEGCESSRLQITGIIREITVTTQPVDQTDCKGNSAKFTVVAAAGGFPVTYQWQRKRQGETDFTNVTDDMTGIDGALKNTLTLTSLGVQNPDKTQFRVIISAESTCPSVVSNSTTLNVNSLVGNLPNFGTCEGNNLSVDMRSFFAFTGTPKTYQWQTRLGTSGAWTDLIEGGHFRGVTTPNLTFINVTSSESAYYRCAVSFDVLPENSTCIEYTDVSHLVVSAYPPAPDVISEYQYCQFSKAKKIIVYGNSPYDVVYYMQEIGGIGFTQDPTPTTQVAGTYYYYVAQQTAQGCESPRSKIKIIINPLPANPINTTPPIVQEGTALTFTADGTNLHWYSSLSDKTPNLDAPNYSVAGTYKAFVSQVDVNGCESNRTEIDVTILPILKITKQPSSQTDCKGNSVTFSITAKANGAITYQWQRKRPNEVNFTDLPNEIAKSLTIKTIGDAENPDLSQYRCVITDGDGTLTSAISTLYVNSITGTLSDINLCEGQAGSINLNSIKINGTIVSYQWQKRVSSKDAWADYSTDASIIIPAVSIQDSAQYRAKLIFRNTDTQTCTITTDLLTVKVYPTPVQPVAADVQYCQNAKATALSATVLKDNTLHWWVSEKDTVVKTKAIIPTTDAVGTFTYFVSQMNKGGCESNRLPIKVKIISSPTITLQDKTYCQYAKTGELLAKPANNLTLTWYSSVKSTQKLSLPIVPTSDKAGTTSYFAVVTDSLGCESPRIELKINVLAAPQMPVANDVIYCPTSATSPLVATVLKGDVLVWYSSANDSVAKFVSPTPSTNIKGTFSFFAAARDSLGCESKRTEIKVNIVPCVADITSNCMQVSVDSVKGNKWFDIFDNIGNIYASVNPNGQDLGKVTVSLRHYGMGVGNIPTTNNGTKLMSRYYDFQSSMLNKFSPAVSLKIYYTNQELEDYKLAVNLPNLTISDFNMVHYDGVRENCGFEDNDNFTLGESVVIYKNILANTFNKNSFYLQFDVPSFSEVGATANDYTELTKFTAEKVGGNKSVMTKWTTLTEIKALKFIVQRSGDNKTWASLGEITALKLPNSSYQYPDNQPLTGKNYYRLIYIDQDGTKKFLDSVLLEFTDSDPICTVFPNPVETPQFNLYLRNIQEKEIRLYNIVGQEISASYTKNDLGILKITPAEKLKDMVFVVTIDANGKRCITKIYVR